MGMRVAIPDLCFADLRGTWCNLRLGRAMCVRQVSWAQAIATKGVAG